MGTSYVSNWLVPSAFPFVKIVCNRTQFYFSINYQNHPMFLKITNCSNIWEIAKYLISHSKLLHCRNVAARKFDEICRTPSNPNYSGSTYTFDFHTFATFHKLEKNSLVHFNYDLMTFHRFCRFSSGYITISE